MDQGSISGRTLPRSHPHTLTHECTSVKSPSREAHRAKTTMMIMLGRACVAPCCPVPPGPPVVGEVEGGHGVALHTLLPIYPWRRLLAAGAGCSLGRASCRLPRAAYCLNQGTHARQEGRKGPVAQAVGNWDRWLGICFPLASFNRPGRRGRSNSQALAVGAKQLSSQRRGRGSPFPIGHPSCVAMV